MKASTKDTSKAANDYMDKIGMRNQVKVSLRVLDKPEKCHRKAKDGDVIMVHYRGTLKSNGVEFDSSYKRNQPFKVTLGAHEVIPGWEQGLQGLCVGEKVRLFVPAALGYAGQELAKIPANSDLIFEIKVLAIAA